MTSRPVTTEAQQAADAADARRIKAALRAASGNVHATAATLAVPYRTLQRRITTLGLRAWLSTTYPRSKRQPKR